MALAFPNLEPEVRERLRARGIDPERSLREWFLIMGVNPERRSAAYPSSSPLSRGSYVPCDPRGRRALGACHRLTEREIEVVALVAVGEQDGEIASRLEVGLYTVKTQVASARRKLVARNRAHLVTRAFEEDVIHLLEREAA